AAVALEERAESLSKRSIKREAKVWALELAIRTMDLTTLEGADTPGKVAALCSKGVRPDPADPSIPSVAAICVYPNLVPTAKERLRGSGVKVASVATGFPSGPYPTDLKIADARRPVELGHATRCALHARSGPRRSRGDRAHGRLQAGRRRARGEAGDPASRARARDARPGMADAGSLPDRRLVPPERRAHAAAEAEDGRV